MLFWTGISKILAKTLIQLCYIVVAAGILYKSIDPIALDSYLSTVRD